MSYGCYNRKDYRPKLMVQDGWWLDGQARMAKVRQIPFTMTKDCQYTKTDLGQADEGCHGCKRRMDLSTTSGHNSGNLSPEVSHG